VQCTLLGGAGSRSNLFLDLARRLRENVLCQRIDAVAHREELRSQAIDSLCTCGESQKKNKQDKHVTKKRWGMMGARRPSLLDGFISSGAGTNIASLDQFLELALQLGAHPHLRPPATNQPSCKSAHRWV